MLNPQVKFDELLNSTTPEVRILAKNYQELEAKLKLTEISQAEFDELSDDLLDITKIKDNMQDLSTLTKLREAAMIIIQAKTTMSLF